MNGVGRRDQRQAIRIPVGLWARAYDHGEFVPTQGNISRGGARATLPTVPRDEQLEVVVNLGAFGVLRLQARMVGILPGPDCVDIRMQFVGLTAEDERALAGFIDTVTQEARGWESLAAAA